LFSSSHTVDEIIEYVQESYWLEIISQVENENNIITWATTNVKRWIPGSLMSNLHK
jgi:hypothetical protein